MAEKITTFVSENRDQDQTLVVVFLRGGADGLNLVVPVEDDDYHRARPTIGISKSEALALDGSFRLNPLLSEMLPLYREGLMSVVHCVGSEDETRSHFEAQDLMEHGGFAAGGWLGRFLLNRQGVKGGPLAAVAIGQALPESLRGAPAATAIRTLEDFSLGAESDSFTRALAAMYGLNAGLLGKAGADTMAALERIETLVRTRYEPANGALYADDAFSSGLREVARLIKARVGLEAACVDLGGWDSHLSQGTIINPRVEQLSRGIGAFCRDLGKAMERTTVVVMTEFGRRVEENSALGTDHGRGSVMFVLGGGHRGGRVHANWPGLKPEALEGPGDLPVTTNYRNVLAPLVSRLAPETELAAVFPGFALDPLGLF